MTSCLLRVPWGLRGSIWNLYWDEMNPANEPLIGIFDARKKRMALTDGLVFPLVADFCQLPVGTTGTNIQHLQNGKLRSHNSVSTLNNFPM